MLVRPFFARRTQLIKKQGLPAQPGFLDWVLLAALIREHRREGRLEELAVVHQQAWATEGALAFHEMAEGRFDHWWKKHHCQIVAPIRQVAEELSLRFFCEIGCGSGLILEDVSKELPDFDRFLGLDLSAEQIERNRQRFNAHPRLHFQHANAIEWIAEHAEPRTLFFTSAGVLEYFKSDDLRPLLKGCHDHKSPCAFAIIEPLYDGFDVNLAIESKVGGWESSLSHPYPHYFREAGYEVCFQKEMEVEGFRWLLLVAKSSTKVDIGADPTHD